MLTIISLATRQLFDITANKDSENMQPCPECSPSRRKKNAKSFSFNVSKGVGHCRHCEASFVEHKPHEVKVYKTPDIVFENYTKISDKAVKYFEGRGISQKTLLSMKIGEKKEWMPQIETEANCVMFPFFKNGKIVNVKYRDAAKNFKLSSGCELVWYNYDAITACIEAGGELAIVEGEIDALSVIQSGHDYVISVPNGASTGKMEYFDSSFELLNQVKTFIIATDNDIKGLELKNDLVRRLGFERCKIVNFKGNKDSNDVLVSLGADALYNTLNSAELVKLSDIYEVKDFENDLDSYFEDGLPQGKTLGIPELDEKIRWMTGHFGIVTGAPTSGKSEFVDFVCAKLNILYGWKTAYYSPESAPMPLHFARIFSKFAGIKFGKKYGTPDNVRFVVQDYISENFFWVSPMLDFDITAILKRFEYLIKSKGVKVFVVDPFNRIEMEQEYTHDKILFIKKILGKLSAFCKMHDALLLLVAHPTKLAKDKDGKFPMPSMYDISGSADFFNMTSYGISVRREQHDETLQFLTFGQVGISKAKFNESMGSTGVWEFRYDIDNGRYASENRNGSVDYDKKNWVFEHNEKQAVRQVLPTISPSIAFPD